MRVSVIATVRNEKESIGRLLDSLRSQTRQPDEIVICDGGSTDGTLAVLEAHAAAVPSVRILRADGANISQGRNAAIAAATGDVIAATDAGVRLDERWLEHLTAPFAGADPPDVVSGFFVPDVHGVFETAMGATVLPHQGDVRPETFLPSSRSVAFRKEAWRAVGGYPEWLDYCEDLVFDLALRRAGFRFVFAPKAVVHFKPRSSLGAFFRQYYRYARGDGKADLWRKRHAIRYGTYIAAPLAIVAALRYNVIWLPLLMAGLAYCSRPWQRLWPQMSGWSPVQKLQAIMLVPVIRFVGDLAKMCGYPAGVWWRIRRRSAHAPVQGDSKGID